ncbi:NADP-dependent 3-hydroxy acid dehydrogenase YdfG [Antricoccus suffuscus]|uniref:NADP-dependent 3-hydroxy acid dehydrogenase YdfG n=1 Tax=Antricoccus suffuscus TaxID=1629062 RepID=A0A2T1A525_9ACTN|nr:SDR family oxidoreductase [Antricoccus suffuscus]PRZ43705.1 NADP-dependent 3-hydroxy acid dehydrogenase YdfG [Antricoccus suffuscus]
MAENGPIVVVGATGFLGSRLVRLLADREEHVVGVGRDTERLAALGDDIRTYQVDMADPHQAAMTVDTIVTDVGPPRAVIAALGGWYVEDETVDVTIERWEGTLRANLTTHFVSAKSFAPALGGADPAYIALNGIASHYPCVGSVAVSAAGAAQRMLIDVLAAETIGRAVRFHELVINTPVLEPGDVHDKDEATHTTHQVCDTVMQMVNSPAMRETRRVELN